MSGDMSALPEGSLILVTGGTGFIGSHVIYQALKAGLRVRAAVRSVEKGLVVKSFFASAFEVGKIDYVIVDDMARAGAYVEAVKDVAGIVHLASVLPRPGITYDEIIPPTIAGVASILRAACNEPSVKRFVLTSSNVTAGVNRTDGPMQHWDATTWNQDAENLTIGSETTDAMSLYAASKVRGERFAWDFVKNNDPGFVLNTILPNGTLGRMFPGFIPSTGAWTPLLANGQGEFIKSVAPQWFGNVTDVALLHIIALLNPVVLNERLYAVTAPFCWNDIVRAIKKIKPDSVVPLDFFGDEGEKTPTTTIDIERTKELMEPHGGLKSLEQTVRDSFDT